MSGYLINRLYIPRLLAYWIQRLRTMLQKEKLQEYFTIQYDLQMSDLWVGFNTPIGQSGWVYNHDSRTNETTGEKVSIDIQPLFERKSVAICHVATNRYNQYVSAIQKDCYLKFLKIHKMEFFLFTDQPENYANQTDEGSKLHVYPVSSRGSSQDNLYRFHFLYQAREELLDFDHVFYMDVDYRIYQHPADKQLLISPAIVATAHVHNLVEEHLVDSKNDINYTSGFHGGTPVEYLEMCQTIRDQIDKNDQNETKLEIESYLNQYLMNHPPTSTLSQSYLFSERCLDMNCNEPMCNALRLNRLNPVMGHI